MDWPTNQLANLSVEALSPKLKEIQYLQNYEPLIASQQKNVEDDHPSGTNVIHKITSLL